MRVATYAAAQVLRVVPRAAISRAVGALCEAELPAPLMRGVVAAYSRAYGVAAEEADPRGLPYGSFDAFFTRKLREGARSLEGDDRTLVSPADGLLSEVGRIGAPRDDGALRIKAEDYTLAELLDDAELARDLCGGAFGVVYLSPRDYHRVHSPVGGQIVRLRGVEGDRFPVNGIGERHVRKLFAKNRRVVVEIESRAWGRVVVVLVGAIIVGRMTIVGIDQPDVVGAHRPVPPIPIARGGELGAFHLGSTVVLAVGPQRLERITRGPGPVCYGQAVAIASAGNAAEDAR